MDKEGNVTNNKNDDKDDKCDNTAINNPEVTGVENLQQKSQEC